MNSHETQYEDATKKHQALNELTGIQYLGARSDQAKIKTGFILHSKGDIRTDTETDHLQPKTIHLPCSPKQAMLW